VSRKQNREELWGQALGIWIYGGNWGALILEQETWKPKDRIAHGASILRSALLRRTGSERRKYFQADMV